MTEWKARRFWTAATVEPAEHGFAVLLDGRPVRTPAKTRLLLPTDVAARAVAAEWQAQDKVIDPRTMPVTRAANAALDKVTPQRDEVIGLLAAYGETDLICYRAPAPADLVARQAAAWDPLLDWASDRFGGRLVPVQGVIPASQPPRALAALRAPLDAMSPFQLTAMSDLIGLTGSLVLGLAAIERHLPCDDLWRLSRIDEDYQQELWGADEEASEQAAARCKAFHMAMDFFAMVTEKA